MENIEQLIKSNCKNRKYDDGNSIKPQSITNVDIISIHSSENSDENDSKIKFWEENKKKYKKKLLKEIYHKYERMKIQKK